MKILITSPSLDNNKNISGISSVTSFIIEANSMNRYYHFPLGKRDNERRNLSWFLRILFSYMKWIWLMMTGRKLLVHFNFALSRPSIIRDSPLILISRLFRKRMVIHLHGGEFLMHKMPPRWMNLILKLVLAERVPKIVLSTLEKEALEKRMKVRNIHVLPNCINLPEIRGGDCSCRKHEILTLLFLGRISTEKGIEYILRAVRALKARKVRFKFIMAGAGPDEHVYIRRFSDILGTDFEFMGVVTGSQKSALFSKCDVFLLPSFFEGLPMALIESMSYGLVPVTTGVGSILQVVENSVNGIIVSTHSSDQIVAAIEHLNNDRLYLSRLSKNAKGYILDKFNPDSYIKQLNEIYCYK